MQYRIVVDQSKFELVNPAIAAQHIAREVRHCGEIYGSFKLPIKALNRYWVSICIEEPIDSTHSKKLAAFNVESKLFSVFSLENTVGGPCVQLRNQANVPTSHGEFDWNANSLPSLIPVGMSN